MHRRCAFFVAHCAGRERPRWSSPTCNACYCVFLFEISKTFFTAFLLAAAFGARLESQEHQIKEWRLAQSMSSIFWQFRCLTCRTSRALLSAAVLPAGRRCTSQLIPHTHLIAPMRMQLSRAFAWRHVAAVKSRLCSFAPFGLLEAQCSEKYDEPRPSPFTTAPRPGIAHPLRRHARNACSRTTQICCVLAAP